MLYAPPTMSITFAVDDVAPAAERLPERDVPIASLATHRVLGASPATLRLVDPAGLLAARRHGGAPQDRMNALVQAVDLAFNEHRPLRLTPDAVWITLAQGFSLHVRENAEALRARFVRHEGRAKVGVEVDAVPRGEAWRAFIAELSEATAEHLGPGVVALLTRPFSTTDDDARTVFRIALLETFSPYFEYEMVCICGIPTITLTGTVDDWRDLRRRVVVMGEYDLRGWTDALLPLCDQWIATAEGRPDVNFWRAIHRPKAVYGGHLITGWLARLFPYTDDGRGRWQRFEPPAARQIPEDATKPAGRAEALARLAARQEAEREGRGEVIPWAIAGVSPRSLPPSWSACEIIGRELATGFDVRVSGGLAGVAQDADGTLSPVVAWLAESTDDATVLKDLGSRHALIRGAPSAQVRPDGYYVPALRGAMLAFFRRYERGTLYDGAIEILPRAHDLEATDPGELPLRDGGACYVRWFRRGLYTFATTRGGGALAHVARRPILAGGHSTVSPLLPEELDWIVYIPDLAAPDAGGCVVLAFDAWTFLRELAAREVPWFLDSATGLGRYVDLLRDPPPELMVPGE